MLWLAVGLVIGGNLLVLVDYLFWKRSIGRKWFDVLFKLGVLAVFVGFGVTVWQLIAPAVLLYWKFVP